MAQARARPLKPPQEVSPLAKARDRGPPNTEVHVSPCSRHGRSRSSTIRLDASSYRANSRHLKNLSTSSRLAKGGFQIPERVVRRSRDTRSQSANRSIRSKSEASIQRTYELVLSAAYRARPGHGSHQLYLDVASHHSQGDRSPSSTGSRSGVPTQRTYTRGRRGVRKPDLDQEAGDLIQKKLRRLATQKRAS